MSRLEVDGARDYYLVLPSMLRIDKNMIGFFVICNQDYIEPFLFLCRNSIFLAEIHPFGGNALFLLALPKFLS